MIGRLPLPMNKKTAVVAGVAMVTMVASLGATMTGAVRPVRARGGRFYRPTSGLVWQAPRHALRPPREMTMVDAMAMLEVGSPEPVDPGSVQPATARVGADEDGLEPDPAPGVRQALLG
ncbi:MAG: hypothetical protein AAF480_17405 [Actinomycetota bacterium]